tara:strand:- start:276 stop:683 length:408 start_codon:yes stop_codon:yes gene_type:complete
MDRQLNIAAIIAELKDNGVNFVGCYYEGGGDSGAIEYYTFFNEEFNMRWDDNYALDYSENGNMDSTIDQKLKHSVETQLEDLFYNELNTIEDWWNNDGGYGSMLLNLETMEFKINNNVRYTDVEEYSHDGSVELE